MEAAVSTRTKLLIYTSPSNPLSWVATVDEQQRLLDFARRHKLWLLADEVYDRLCYRGASIAPSILKLASDNDAILIAQSFSKAWCMTGWRLGWLIARPDLASRAAYFNEYIISCASAISQKAGEAALNEGEPFIEELLTRLRENRDYCRHALSSIPGVTVPEPEGAFYLFPKIEGLKDSFAFCKDLLLACKVGLAPGAAFGAGGEGSVRLCYAADCSVLEPAMERIHKFMTR